jgi:hypothetical protein
MASLTRTRIQPATVIMLSLFMCQLPVSGQLLARPETQIASFEIASLHALVSLALFLDLRDVQAWISFLEMLGKDVYDFAAFEIFSTGVDEEGGCARG